MLSPTQSALSIQDGLPINQRILAIMTIVLTLAMAMLDGSIANLALPQIAADMSATASESIWIINSYQIAMAVLLLPLASLGEVVGYRKIYLTGIVVFTVASLLCALSETMLQLSLARILQGIGAAGILSVNAALIRFIYPKRLLGAALGYNALVAGTANALGPTIAGFILHATSWHWLFFINIPIGIFALCIGITSLPFNELSSRKYDTKSALCCMTFVGLLLYSIDLWGHMQTVFVIATSIAATVIAFLFLLKIQSKDAPMFPLDLLKIPVFVLSIGTSFFAFTAYMAVFVLLPFYMQDELAMNSIETGLLMTSWPIAVALTAPFAGKLSDRIPSGILGGIGMIIMSVGIFSLLFIDRETSHLMIVVQFLLCGFGFGLYQSPNNRTIIGSAPRSRTGGASGMLGTSRLLGQTTGASLVALMLMISNSGAMHVFLVAGILTLVASIVSFTRIKFMMQK